MAEANTPRSGDERAAARAAARREQRARQRRLLRSKKRWRAFIAIYSLLFLAAGAAACYVLYRYERAMRPRSPST